MDKLFIDETVTKYIGPEAEALLSQTNDLKYLGANGIAQVSQDRWEQAQRYERRTWLELNPDASDDRNYEHMERFGGYEVLKGKTFDHVVELGCGPFTNVRLIDPLIKSETLTLVDPLILDYIRSLHNNLGYGIFQGVQYAHCGAIEDYVPSRKFDLVVMVNVLEHCRDAQRVFDKILEITAQGGTLVFSEPTWPVDVIQSKAANEFDAGHPLRVSNDFVCDFLSNNFTPLYVHEFYGLYDQEGRQDIYYIGRKK